MSTTSVPGTYPVTIPAERVLLQGELSLPEHPLGIVLLLNGTTGGSISERSRRLAADLHARGLATLLVNLGSAEERRRLSGPHDLVELAERLLSVTEWAGLEPETRELPQAYFATGVGAAIALVAAARAGHKVHAVVCRGGRPDLARDWLGEVTAPTLLLVGSDDLTILRLNREAQRLLQCPSRLAVVRGASQTFEEPGALDAASQETATWFGTHLGPAWQPQA